ncbi:MAG TPA: hypothetical protein VF029_04200 [Actinomycetota bacterium]
MSQPLGPVHAEAHRPWHRLAMALGVGLLATVALAAKAVRAPASVPVTSRPTPVRGHEIVPRAPAEPTHGHTGPGATEERRQEAGRRAEAAEERARELEGQLRQALTQIREMEATLTMNEDRTAQYDGEMEALREQLRDTAERLHQAETDNEALRERLGLRQQELDGARSRLASDGEDAEALRARLEAAEARVAELTEAMRKLEAELDYTKSRFHLSMLTAALRESDNDDIQIEENGHHDPVIVRRTSLQPGKVG